MNKFNVRTADNVTGDIPLRMEALAKRGAPFFDPVRFRYIEAMARRTLQQQGSAKRILENKLETILTDFQRRFTKAREETAAIVAHVAVRYPDSSDDVQRLFAKGDFKGVAQRIARLEQTTRADPIAELRRYRQHKDTEAQPVKEFSGSYSFDDLLVEQEKEALHTCASGIADPRYTPQPPLRELKSVQFFRDTWARLSADKRVAQAVDNPPANTGPLNSHGLVLRALATLREISPDYLNRFVSYVDTLLWLEQASKKKEASVDKTPAGRIKTKPGRKRSN